MVKSHLHNILTYYGHGITNAVGDGINSAIPPIKKRADGERNVANSRPPSSSIATASTSTRHRQLGYPGPRHSRKSHRKKKVDAAEVGKLVGVLEGQFAALGAENERLSLSR